MLFSSSRVQEQLRTQASLAKLARFSRRGSPPRLGLLATKSDTLSSRRRPAFAADVA
jgi:hypothetical protein